MERFFKRLVGAGFKSETAEKQVETAVAAWAEPVHVTSDTFAEVVLGASQPVLVDFWASWCGPCRMAAPIVEKLAEVYSGRAVIAKVNVDDEVELAARLEVQGIPTFIFYQDGKEVDRVVGFGPRHVLEGKLADLAR